MSKTPDKKNSQSIAQPVVESKVSNEMLMTAITELTKEVAGLKDQFKTFKMNFMQINANRR